MNTLLMRSAIVAALGMLPACRSIETPPRNVHGLPVDYSPSESFDPGELRSLAKKSERGPAERRRMLWLILRAAAEKHTGFRDLVGRQDLRGDRELDLALSGYDYAVNGNEEALDHILAEDRKLSRGGDYTTIQVMSFLDEWDRTVAAIRSHEKHAEGAGSIAVMSFWQTRDHFSSRWRAAGAAAPQNQN